MRKLLTIVSIFMCSLFFGQFTITESSNDWKLLGKRAADISISTNGNKAKLTTIDFRSKTMGFDPLATFKSRGQNNLNNLRSDIRKGNEGVKSGDYEFVFSIDTETLDNLYNIIKDHFDEKKKETLTLSFPEGNLYLDFNSKTGFYALSFGIDSGDQKIFSAPIFLSHARKIFGKTN